MASMIKALKRALTADSKPAEPAEPYTGPRLVVMVRKVEKGYEARVRVDDPILYKKLKHPYFSTHGSTGSIHDRTDDFALDRDGFLYRYCRTEPRARHSSWHVVAHVRETEELAIRSFDGILGKIDAFVQDLDNRQPGEWKMAGE